jgi:DNA-binding response OmpR family regulator
MERVLRRAGYETAGSPDGATGIEIFQSFGGRFDAVTLDMCMPGLDGFSTFQALQRLDPNVRVILCSGAADESRVRIMLQSGLACFLPKPFEPTELVHVVSLAIAKQDPAFEETTLSKTA